MKHYPKLTEQGSVTRPHKPRDLGPDRTFNVYDDTGRWLGHVTATCHYLATIQADHVFGPEHWASVMPAKVSGL